MRRGGRGLVAGEMNTGQFADSAVYCATNLAAGCVDAAVWGRGTSDRFPRDCRAPRDRSIHETCRGASRWP
jgi:hypothetical protein